MNVPGWIADNLVPFLILLGPLVFIHELGHFAVAKWLGVKVEKFSIGFGPSLFSRTVGETEYVLAILPLGGFVKMLGEMPGEELNPNEAARAFNTRPVWQRIAIALAGPVMNLVFAVVLITGMLMSGVPTPTSRVGSVVAGSPAEKAGVHRGDRVVAVDGQPVEWWAELAEKVSAPGAATVTLSVEREDGTRADLSLAREKSDEGQWKPLGLSWNVPPALFGVTAPDGAAAVAGFETGDRVTALNGAKIASAFELEHALAGAKPPLDFELSRGREDATETVHVTVRQLAGPPSLAALGIAPIGVAINGVEPRTPAKQAGLKSKDVLLQVGDVLATDPDAVRNTIRASNGQPLKLEILRAGHARELEVVPTERTNDLGGKTETYYGIGVGLAPIAEGAETRDLVVHNPLAALARGVKKTGDICAGVIGGFAQLFSGAVGLGSLSGPIGIGEIAAAAYQESWIDFLYLVAFISVNLAIINLLPIPILDGGQIVMVAAEGIKGSPLPSRARDVALTVGLSLILLLMGVAFWNDIAGYLSGVVSLLKPS